MNGIRLSCRWQIGHNSGSPLIESLLELLGDVSFISAASINFRSFDNIIISDVMGDWNGPCESFGVAFMSTIFRGGSEWVLCFFGGGGGMGTLDPAINVDGLAA